MDSTVTVGMQDQLVGRSYDTFSLVRDSRGQVFRMKEYLGPGWRQYTYSKRSATQIVRYRLSQEAFGFDLEIILRYLQKTPIAAPAGF